jgi:hypothetical protein
LRAGTPLHRRSWSSATQRVTGAGNDASETASGSRVAESAKVATENSAKDAAKILTPEMKKVAREAAIVVLTLVGKRAATGVTKQLAAKWPEMYRQFVEPRVEEAGGINELAKRVTDSKGLKGIAVGMAAESMLDRFTGAKSGRKADDTGRGRRRPAASVLAATSSSAEQARRPAPLASSQSSATAKRTAKKAAPTRTAPSSATKKASAPPASLPPTPAKAASSARKTTSRRTSR